MKRWNPLNATRHQQYAFYRHQTEPYFGLTASVDAGPLLALKDETFRPFSMVLFCVSAAVNAVPELRQRIRTEDGTDWVVEHDVVSPAFVVPTEHDLFGFASVGFPQPLRPFCADVHKAATQRYSDGSFTPFDTVRDDVFYATCIPWVDFSHVSHPYDTRTLDTVPRIAWGKFRPDQRVSINIQVHHSLVDGRHIGHFFEALQHHIYGVSSNDSTTLPK